MYPLQRGLTALMLSIQEKNDDITALLLGKGVNMNATNKVCERSTVL